MEKDPEKKTTRKDCFLSPQPFVGFGKTIRHVVCFDENGASSGLDYIKKAIAKGEPIDENRRFFTLTGCLFDRDSFFNAAYLLRTVKQQTWRAEGKKVLFHSRDIRRQLGPFNLPPKKREAFIASLSNALGFVTCTVFSISFDLYEYVQGGYQFDPYEVAFDYLLERVVDCLRIKEKDSDPRIAMVFEARGKQENQRLLEHAAKLVYESGTKWARRVSLQRWVRGVFFNEKSTEEDGLNLYPGIEIADLFSYPIHRLIRYGHGGKDYEIVKTKFYGYPRIHKKGLVLFPKSFAEKNKKQLQPPFTARDNPGPTI